MVQVVASINMGVGRNISLTVRNNSNQNISVLGTKKKFGPRALTQEDRMWLVSHTPHTMEGIDKLYKDFHTDYPNGGIFRK